MTTTNEVTVVLQISLVESEVPDAIVVRPALVVDENGAAVIHVKIGR